MSAKEPRFKGEISVPLSGLLALSSPHPRPRSVRVRSQSATTTAVCPWPRTVHVHDPCRVGALVLSANSPQTRIVRGQSVSASDSQLVHDPVLSTTAAALGTVRLLEQPTATVWPQTRFVRDQSVTTVNPRPVREHDARMPVR